MTLKEKVKEALKIAMKEHNEAGKNALKSLVAGFTNELVANGKTPQDEVTDELALKVIKKAVKQRKDSIKQFEKANRPELVAKEKEELEILEDFLPEQMSEETILGIAKKKKEELNIENKSKIGILIGAVIKETKGQADGSIVSKIVNSLF